MIHLQLCGGRAWGRAAAEAPRVHQDVALRRWERVFACEVLISKQQLPSRSPSVHDLTAFFPWLGVRVTSQPYSREKQGPQEGAGSPQSQEPECRPGERGCTPPPADTPGHERPGLVALNHLIIHLANVSPQAESGSIHSEFQIIIVFQIACMGPLQSQRVTTIGQQGPVMEIS